MSVVTGSPVSSDNVNSAFVSKTSTTEQEVVATINLNHGSSGGQISNAQQEINDIKSNYRWQTDTVESIAASGGITSVTDEYMQYRRVQGDGAARVASTTPFGTGAGWTDGIVIRLVGQSDTNTLQLTHSDIQYGAILNGNCNLSKYYSITLQYDSVLQRWIEQSRNF